MQKQGMVEAVVTFSQVKRFDEPYKYFHAEGVFSPEVASALLNWISTSDLYVQKEERFYRNSWFSISEKTLPEHLKDVFNRDVLLEVKRKVEEIFQVSFTDEVLVFAQKYLPGEGTLIHTDYMEPDSRDYNYFFTHRMIVYLNEEWKETNGGLFGVFSEADPAKIVAAFPPLHNTAVGLAHGPTSFHAVSAVTEGVRYAIQFSFLSTELKYEGE